ncbi:MAG: transcriptional coactivator/pterin dehydratase, partial [Myxococcales bacterium]|nr:transcriptional coactivator/pterin dehydratase [Myxococcales bacterium]
MPKAGKSFKQPMSKLQDKHCVPCEGGTPPLDDATTALLLAEVVGWKRQDAAGGPRITKALAFTDFVAAMAFLDKLAILAEAEGHHPDFCVH